MILEILCPRLWCFASMVFLYKLCCLGRWRVERLKYWGCRVYCNRLLTRELEEMCALVIHSLVKLTILHMGRSALCSGYDRRLNCVYLLRFWSRFVPPSLFCDWRAFSCVLVQYPRLTIFYFNVLTTTLIHYMHLSHTISSSHILSHYFYNRYMSMCLLN